MSPLVMFLLAAAAWVACILVARWVVVPLLRYGPDREPVLVLIWRCCQLYARVVHRVRYVGEEAIRRKIDPGGLIVVSNHTSAADPLLIQCGCTFAIRWLMAAEMMTPQLDWLWNLVRIVPVSRNGSDSRPVREAIRHVRGGGVIGIFPEARIVKPRGEIRPFMAGLGVIVARTKAPVLLVWVSGTPDVPTMGRTFYTPSRSRVEYVEIMEFPDTRDAEEITRRVRERLAQASGWPLNEEPMAAEAERPETAVGSRSSAHGEGLVADYR